MDPDMVRQQEEAEREALALLAKKSDIAAPPAASIPHTVLLQARDAAPSALEADETPLHIPAAAGQVIEPQTPPARRRARGSLAARLGRFVSFGAAGAMLGGGLGIAVTNYFELAAEWGWLAIYGPAALLAAACAIASLYTKSRHE